MCGLYLRCCLCNGQVTQGALRVSGSLALVTQQPWIAHASIRDNILLHGPWDPDHYHTVLAQTCLAEDLLVLPAGDATEVLCCLPAGC